MATTPYSTTTGVVYVIGSLPTTPVTLGGTGTQTQFTQGSVVFAGANGIYTQDNSNFYYDSSSHNLRIGGAVNYATTPLDGLVIENSTPATVGVPAQYSPRIRYRGTAWDVNDGVSRTIDAWWQNEPLSANAPDGQLVLYTSVDGGAPSQALVLSGAGTNSSFLSGITTGGDVIPGANRGLQWSGKTILSSPADGQLNIMDHTQATGIGLDATTDAVLLLRTRAQSAYATLDALAYKVSGAAGLDASVTTAGLVGKTMTFSKGILTGFA
jgi:hypothetical protein